MATTSKKEWDGIVAIKSDSIRIEEMLNKITHIADYCI